MAEFPKFPLWTDAYLGDTHHLTTTEHGAYLLLLIALWRTKGNALPNDDKLLARYSRLSAGQWARIKPVLMPFFIEEDGKITQPRLTDEANAVRQHSGKQSDKAKARWRKDKGKDDAGAVPDGCPDDASLSLSLSPEVNPKKKGLPSGARKRAKASSPSNSTEPGGYVWERSLSFGENQTRAWVVEWAKTRTRPRGLLDGLASGHLRALVDRGFITELERAWLLTQLSPSEASA